MMTKIYRACRPERSALRMRLLKESLARSRRTPRTSPFHDAASGSSQESPFPHASGLEILCMHHSTHIVRCFRFVTPYGMKASRRYRDTVRTEFPASASQRTDPRDPSTSRFRVRKQEGFAWRSAQDGASIGFLALPGGDNQKSQKRYARHLRGGSRFAHVLIRLNLTASIISGLS